MSSFLSSEPGHDAPRNGALTKDKPRAAPAQQFLIPLNIAFYILLVARLLAASNAPIQDCDETFNYWEPLHYLTHSSGLQTWEYSPNYSIRSWAYILIHALPIKLISLFGTAKPFQFYILRCLLGTICATTELRLYSAISRTLNPRIGAFYLAIVALTPGYFYASAAFLPSSFAMYTSTLGLSIFMDWRTGSPRTANAITFFGLGALLGWPFAGALIVPFVLEDMVLALIGGDFFSMFMRYLDGTVRCIVILGLQTSVDAFFYRKFTIVPLNAILYNIFSTPDRGPNIFGTEPWHFYVRNLILNFNIWFLLALAVAPMLAIQALFLKSQTTSQTLLRTITLISPFYLWFAIFTIQPHKEERFMFPAYHFLALNASIAFHMLLSWISSPAIPVINRIPPRIKTLVVLPIILGSFVLSLLRVAGTVTAYRAPLQIYEALSTLNMTSSANAGERTLCLGKDWYRFPSSFMLPDNIKPAFIESEFDGLLPGSFHEAHAGAGLGLFPGTHMIPVGMNDRNIEDPGKHVDVRQCDYLVDSLFPSTMPNKLEPDYSGMQEWKEVRCDPFLDSASTGLLARTVWVPDLPFIPARYRRVWGKHCLLQRTDRI